jgi:hypothetical protein
VPIVELVREGGHPRRWRRVTKPVIGTPNATGGPDIFTRMKRLMTRVENLERRR